VAVNVLNNGYSIKNVPCQINKEYVITAYFRIFLPDISPWYSPHILWNISGFFWHAYLKEECCNPPQRKVKMADGLTTI